MPMTCVLHLRAEGLPDKDLIGSQDPYFEVMYKDEVVYKSEVLEQESGSDVIEWAPAEFEMSRSAYLREIRIVIKDKDTFTRDDVLLDCEIRYPFRPNTYTFSDLGCKLCVLNDDGDETDGEREGSECEDDDGSGAIGTALGLAGNYFKVRMLGKALGAAL